MITLGVNQTKAARTDIFKSMAEYSKDMLWTLLCMVVQSNSDTELHEWINDMPGMVEWFGERTINALKKYSYTLKNRDWEMTIGINENTWKDNPGLYKPRLAQMGASAAEHPEELVFDALVDGATDLCFDGKAFFATDHPASWDGGDDFSNKLTGSGADTVAHVTADFNSARIAFLEFKKRNGRSLFKNIGIPHIFHSPDLAAMMESVFETATLSGGGANTYYKKAVPHVSADLSGDDWYITLTNKPVKPLLFQDREKIRVRFDDSKVFDTKEIRVGADARYAVGYGMPQAAIMIDNT